MSKDKNSHSGTKTQTLLVDAATIHAAAVDAATRDAAAALVQCGIPAPWLNLALA